MRQLTVINLDQLGLKVRFICKILLRGHLQFGNTVESAYSGHLGTKEIDHYMRTTTISGHNYVVNLTAVL